MKQLFYVRTATLTLFEAYPDDPKTEKLKLDRLEENVKIAKE